MIFMLSFSVFVATLPSISLFCTFFNLPLPSTPVWKSLSVYFLLFWYLTYSTPLLLLLCPALSINPAPASFFFVLLFLSVLSGTFNFCTGTFVLFSLGPFLSWYFSWLGVGGDSALAPAVHWVLGRIRRSRWSPVKSYLPGHSLGTVCREIGGRVYSCSPFLLEVAPLSTTIVYADFAFSLPLPDLTSGPWDCPHS